ncbi:hypothetical protein A5888_000806 [Enterococcus sp. 9E7_DIV0242]|uniref:Uncharacterized protein n=1 Tax=Candidatus Enterococcus clewellii TaxID=1834193 RepID=A0AAQ3VSF9_9ENTE
MVSFTADKSRAQFYAGKNGIVFEIKVPKKDLLLQTLSGSTESEYLIIHGIGAKENGN